MNTNINLFIDSVIEQKKLQFSAIEASFDNSLFEKNILKLENNKISISNYNLISSSFVNNYKEKLGFEISEEFEENVNFIKKIKDDFFSNGYVHDFYAFEKEIWKTLIKESNSKYKCSFNTYLNSIDIDNKTEGIFNFIDAYSEELPYLEITACTLYNNALKLLEISKSDAHYNIPFGNILNGVKNKCKIDYDLGLILLTKSLTIDEDKENLLSAIITGLYENKRNEFYNLFLEDLIKKENKLNAIFFGLSNVSMIEDIECELFIKLIKKYKNVDFLILSLTSLVFSILKSNNTNYHNFCFEELKSTVENEISAYYILNNLNQIDKYNQEKTDVIINLINQSYFSIEKYINPISTVFWYIKEFESFKKVVLTIIENRPFESFIKIFQSYLHSADNIELDKFTIELLTNNQSSKRFIGLEIFDELSTHNPYKFLFDILELPAFIQYKLWVSLTQDFHEPKKRLIALIPLLESNSDWVKASFLCKLEKISEDYGGLIKKILENNLDSSKSNNNAIERITNYIEVFHNKYVNIKYPITELNPYHTHYKDIKLFNELFSKKMNESINKGAAENSLLGFLGVSTIQLSKGGGWRFGAKNEISQLGKIESSFTMPRSYFINPNEFELEKGFLNREDWNDEEFLEIKTFLENE